MMKTMIPPQVEMRLQAKKRGHKKEKIRPKQKNKKREKKREGTMLLSTLVLQSSTMFFMIESLLFCHFHILLVGIFHYRTWPVYFNDGFPQMPEVFMRKQVGCRTS